MYQFTYHRPKSLDEVKKILSDNEEAKLLAGGMTLLPTMKMRLAQPSDLIDMSNVDGLSDIKDDGDAIEVGAMVRHADVAASDVVREAIPALAELAEHIGDAQVRNRGTIGGSVANSDPAADYPAAVLGLNAVVTTGGRSTPTITSNGCSRRPSSQAKSLSRSAFPSRHVPPTRSFPIPRPAMRLSVS